jgi:competence protein ComGC
LTLNIKGNSDFDALKTEFNRISLPDLNSAVEETGWLEVYGNYADNAGDALASISATIDRLQCEYDGLKTDFDASKKNLKELNKLVTDANETADNYDDWYEKYELVQYYVLDAISEYKQTVKDLKSEYTTVANQGLLIDAQEREITTYTDYAKDVNAAITKLSGLNTASTEKEYAALGDAINLLKSDFNGLTDDQKASIDYQTVQAKINRIQTEYDALTNTDNPDYTYAKTAAYNPEKKNYDIYRDLESRVASERAAMPGNAEKISTQKDTLLADVNSLLTNVNAEIKNLQYAGYDLLTEDNKATVDDEVAAYKEQLSELKTQVTDFKTSINNISGGSLLVLIENKTITNNRTALEDDYAALAGKIATSKKPYETNYNSYKAALNKLEASGKVLDEAVTTVGDFANETLTRSSKTYTIARTKDAIEAKKEELKNNVSKLSYTEEPDELKVGDFTVDGVAALFVKRYEQKQLLDRLDALKDADGLYTQVEALIDPTSTYLTVTIDELNNDLYAVGQLIQTSQYNIKGDYEDAIGDTRYDSYNGTDFYEIVSDGSDILFSKVKTDADGDYDDIVAELEALKEKIKANKYVLGDINKDGKVAINDYDALRDIIIEKSEISDELDKLRYDVNGDEEVNIGDVQNVVAIITGKFQGLSAARRAAAADTSGDAVSLRSIGEGISRKLSVLLDNTVAYTGAQFDITLPEGVTLNGVNLTARSAGLDVVFNEVAKGIYRVLISSLDNISFQGNEGSIVDLDVEVSPSYDGSGVSLANVITTDVAARAYHLDADAEATGIATVSATTYVKEKIYSVGGQLLDGLKKGVNIIRGNDGSTKKVMHK